MYKPCSTEFSANRQRLLAHAMLELMREKPFEAIFISDLCEAVPMPRRTFYRYFDNRDDVVDFLFDMAVQNIQLEGGGPLPSYEPDSWRKSFAKRFAFWRDHQSDLLDALIRNNLMEREISRSLRVRSTDPENSKAEYASDFFANVREAFGTIMCYQLLIAWHSEGYQKTPEELTDILLDLLTTPFLEPDF